MMPHAWMFLAPALLAGLASWRAGRRSSLAPGRGRRRAWAALAATAGMLAAAATAAAGVSTWYYHRAQPAPAARRLFHGITYTRESRRAPRTAVIHVVEVDLKAEGIAFLVTPAEPASKPGPREFRARTTSGFLDEFGLQVAVNANYYWPFRAGPPWDYYPRAGEPVHVVGISASRGRVDEPGRWRDGTLYISEANAASFDEPVGPVYNAIAGNGLLVRDGRPLGPFPRDLYPRVGVGLDAAASRLILVVVDGKQPNYSEGVTLDELAAILVDRGAHTAARLDEGGSGTLVAQGPDGSASQLNCPVNSRIPYYERPVANHLGIYARR